MCSNVMCDLSSLLQSWLLERWRESSSPDKFVGFFSFRRDFVNLSVHLALTQGAKGCSSPGQQNPFSGSPSRLA